MVDQLRALLPRCSRCAYAVVVAQAFKVRFTQVGPRRNGSAISGG